MTGSVDAVVIGAGPNGLVAANALVDAGWQVLLLEADPHPGGAVKTAEVTAPGFRNDLYSAFYPLAAGSRIIAGLELDRFGLTWVHAPSVLAHATADGRAAVLHRDPAATAAGLDDWAAGDGAAWLAMAEQWQRVRDDVLDALFTPIPPVRALARLARRLGARGLLDLARLSVLPVRRLGEEQFRGDGGRLLLTGNAMHADLSPAAAGSGVFGWLLAMLGQDVGFPVPQGGAGELATALVRRFEAGGGELRTGSRVTSVTVRGGRATGVRTADGLEVEARRAVLADVDAPTLYRELIGQQQLPTRLRGDLERFERDGSTLKVNYALSAPLPWRADGARGAGTVHTGADLDGCVDVAADLTVGRMPASPFLLVGQMTTSDPTRSPAGSESMWAYTHVPPGRPAEALEAQVGRVEAVLDRQAPGWRDLVLARMVQLPGDLQQGDANLVGGAVNGGTSGLHQQLFFRPTPGLGRPETYLPGLFLASAGAHPGGGVHGACGWNAARAALAQAGPVGAVRKALLHTTWERLLR